jgi:hypothetical protein
MGKVNGDIKMNKIEQMTLIQQEYQNDITIAHENFQKANQKALEDYRSAKLKAWVRFNNKLSEIRKDNKLES